MSQQVAQTQQQVHGAEAIGHKHLLMGHLLGKTVGQQQNLSAVGCRAEKVGDGLQDIVSLKVKQGCGKQHHGQTDGNVPEDQNDMLQFFMVAVEISSSSDRPT